MYEKAFPEPNSPWLGKRTPNRILGDGAGRWRRTVHPDQAKNVFVQRSVRGLSRRVCLSHVRAEPRIKLIDREVTLGEQSVRLMPSRSEAWGPNQPPVQMPERGTVFEVRVPTVRPEQCQ